MKRLPGFARLTHGPFRRKWINGAIFLTAVALSAGCGKKSEPVAPPAPQTNTEAPSQPAAAPVNQAANQPNAVNQANQPNPTANRTTAAAAAPAAPDLAAVNRAVRSWILANRRPPRSFEDF